MNPQEILHTKKLKHTGCREGILSLILESDFALSENEIRDKLDGRFDRTTFYRSFKTLLENDIIHKIVVDNQMVKYAFDKQKSNTVGHAHFFCKSCRSVVCLETTSAVNIKLPGGYKVHETEIIIRGKCNRCSGSKKKHE